MNGWLTALVVVLALLVSVFGGWAVAAGVLRLAARSSDAGRPEDEPREEPRKRERDSGGDRAAAEGATLDDTDEAATDRATDDDALDESARSDGPVGPRAREALRGGTWIGILERVGVTGSLLVGDPTGVAVVVAIKGLGRFPELREHPAASERFVIGTLASLVFAAAVGVLGRALLLS